MYIAYKHAKGVLPYAPTRKLFIFCKKNLKNNKAQNIVPLQKF